MWITGTGADVLHCQHCNPSFHWVVYKPGEPPQFAYTGFPENGQVTLSRNKVIVLCRACSGAMDLMTKDLKTLESGIC